MNRAIKPLRRWNVLVTPKEASDAMRHLRREWSNYFELTISGGRVEDAKKLIGLLCDKDAAVLDLEPITAGILKRCSALKVISRFGEGCETIDLQSAADFGIRVTRTEGVSSLAVARHTMSLILAITHRIIENDRNIKNGLWIRQTNISEPGLALGILGFGKIGRSVARLGRAFGFKILVYNRNGKSNGYKTYTNLDELIGACDILSLHLPLNSSTTKIVSKDVIKRLKGKYLVNTARGGLVDEAALLASLERDGIAGYAADVFSNEPVSGCSKRLARHENVIASPHIAAFDRDTAVKVTERALENVFYCLNGKHYKVASYVS